MIRLVSISYGSFKWRKNTWHWDKGALVFIKSSRNFEMVFEFWYSAGFFFHRNNLLYTTSSRSSARWIYNSEHQYYRQPSYASLCYGKMSHFKISNEGSGTCVTAGFVFFGFFCLVFFVVFFLLFYFYYIHSTLLWL